MVAKETGESLSDMTSLVDGESASAKKSAPVNLQAALDDTQADEPEGSEAEVMAGHFALLSYPQDNPVHTLAGIQKALPSHVSPASDQRQSPLKLLASDQVTLGSHEVVDEAKAATLSHGGQPIYTASAMADLADENGQLLPKNGIMDLPSDPKQQSNALYNGLIMTNVQDMRQPSAAMGDVSIAELQGAEVNSTPTDFPATPAGVDKSVAPSGEQVFATVAATLTSERTRARMGSSSADTITTSVVSAKGNSEGSPALAITNPVNLTADTLNLDTQLPLQEGAGLTGEAARHGVDFSLKLDSAGAEQTFAEPTNSLANTLGRTPAAANNASLPPIRPDTPLALQEGNWEKPIGQQLLWMAQHQTQRAEIRVDPPHLGPIEVHLSLNDDQAKVNFFSHDAAVRETLENALPKLRDLFDSQGMQLNQANVSDQSLARQQSEPSGNPSSRQGNTSRGEGNASGNGENQSDHASQTPDQGNSIVDHYI
jgi:flagellar hook-length control protein FliK